MKNDPMDDPGKLNVPLNANGEAYTTRQTRHGVPLDYIGEKLESAIKEVQACAQAHPDAGSDLVGAMHYLLVAHLGLHNMLAKANDRGLAKRLLDGKPGDLGMWLELIAKEGDVRGLAALDDDGAGR